MREAAEGGKLQRKEGVMPDTCEYCPGGYYDCGPDRTRCQVWNDPSEDRCHYIWVLIRKQGDCCKARLWVPGAGTPPRGWKVFQRVPIRVETNEVEGECVARVHVPQVDCSQHEKCCGPDGDWDQLVVEPGNNVVINIYPQ